MSPQLAPASAGALILLCALDGHRGRSVHFLKSGRSEDQPMRKLGSVLFSIDFGEFELAEASLISRD